MFTNKKSLITLTIILFIAVSALVYLNIKGIKPLINSGLQKAQIAENGVTYKKKLSPDTIKRPVQLSKRPVLSFTTSTDGRKALYYTTSGGRVYEVNLNGENLQQISGARLDNLLKIIWSPNKEEVIGFYNKNGKIVKAYFNYKTKQDIDLNAEIYDISFSPDGKNIAYLLYTPDTEVGGIFISNPDGTAAKELLSTRLKKANIGWMDDNTIYFYKNTTNELIDLFILDINNKQLTTFLETVKGLDISFAPDQKTLLFSGTLLFDKKNNLMIKPLNQEIQKLDSEIPVDNCVWSIDSITLFCSMPDGLWKINIQTQEKTKIFSDLNYSISKPALSPLENYLIFINVKDGLLYSLPL